MLYVLLNVIRNVFQKDLSYPLKKEHNYIGIMYGCFKVLNILTLPLPYKSLFTQQVARLTTLPYNFRINYLQNWYIIATVVPRGVQQNIFGG